MTCSELNPSLFKYQYNILIIKSQSKGMFGMLEKTNKKNISNIMKLFTQTSQFRRFFDPSLGQGSFKQTKCQDIQCVNDDSENQQENNYDEDEFYMDDGENMVEQEVGIKACQFNSGMFAPDNASTTKCLKKEPQINLAKCFNFCLGYNSQSKNTATIINNEYFCYGAGNLVIIKNFKKKNQTGTINFGHLNQISSLMYDSKSNMLFSGTEGMKNRPEIIQWKLHFSETKIQLEQERKLYLPKKSKGVGSLILIDQYLICIDELSMHNNNIIYRFDLSNKQNSRHLGEPLKLNSKLIDFYFSIGKDFTSTMLTTVTSKSVKTFERLFEENKQVELSDKQLSCVSKRGNELVFGTIDGNLWLQKCGKMLGPIHAGWILRIRYIKCEKLKKQFLVSCGGDDKLVKIFQINGQVWDNISSGSQNQQKWKQMLNFDKCKVIEAKNYVTSIEAFENSIILFGFRDGRLLLFDLITMKILFDQNSCNSQEPYFSKYYQIYKPQWHPLTNRLFIPLTPSSKFDKFSSISILNPSDSSSPVVQIPLQWKSICWSLSEDQIATLLEQKKIDERQKYPLLIRNIGKIINEEKQKKSSLKKEDIKESKAWLRFLDDFNADNEENIKIAHLEIDTEKYGKPNIMQYFEGITMLGTNLGYFLLHDLKSNKLVTAPKKHSGSIEDVAYQINVSAKQSIFRFYKTIAQGQLFYWQVIEQEGGLKIKQITQRTKRLKELKAAKWNKLVKYSWESKSVWETMTYYNEINNMCILNDQYLLIVLENGVLRVYNFPAKKQNAKIFRQFQVFDCPFQVGLCSNDSFYCFSKGIFLFFTLPSL